MNALERSGLTRWVAEKCMGWTPVHEQYRPHCGCSMVYDQRQETLGVRSIGPACGMTLHAERDRWDPTTKIEHAWMLVDRMRDLKYWLCLLSTYESTSPYWHALFVVQSCPQYQCPWKSSTAETAPLAITLAVRAALEGAK